MNILVDMDGVLCRFQKAAAEIHGFSEDEITKWDIYDCLSMTPKEFWEPIEKQGVKFWASLEPFNETLKLIKWIDEQQIQWYICSSPALNVSECINGKIIWLEKYFSKPFRNFCFTQHKNLLANDHTLLIDDRDENTQKFRRAGGHAILVPRPWNQAISTKDTFFDRAAGAIDYLRSREQCLPPNNHAGGAEKLQNCAGCNQITNPTNVAQFEENASGAILEHLEACGKKLPANAHNKSMNNKLAIENGQMPEPQKFSTGAVRNSDANKTRFDLISPVAFLAVWGDWGGWLGFDDEEIPVFDAMKDVYEYLNNPVDDEYLINALNELLYAITVRDGKSGTNNGNLFGLWGVASACQEGAQKYGDYNWERGMPVADILNHLLRHMFLFLEKDREEDHLGHAAWNACAAIHSHRQWPELNEELNLRKKANKP